MKYKENGTFIQCKNETVEISDKDNEKIGLEEFKRYKKNFTEK